jgi:hypothetical protein
MMRGTAFGSVINEFLAASAFRRRLNSGVRKGDSTDVVNGKRAIGVIRRGFCRQFCRILWESQLIVAIEGEIL